MGMTIARIVLIIAGSVSATTMAAETLRCSGQLIEPGMTQAQVVELCGEPISKDTEVQDVRSGNRVVGKTEVHRWTYPSPGATRVLVFDQEVLKAIE